MGDSHVFLIGYDDTFDWGEDKGTFFTFHQKGAVQQVEEYISKQHQKLRKDVNRASITLAQKSEGARASIVKSFYPGIDSIYANGYSTHQYFEKDPTAKVYSDAELISTLFHYE
jgi:hypothetical protein